LASEHDELMSQHKQLDVFSERAAAVPKQQPQHSGEGEIGEGQEHAPDTSSTRRKAQEEQERRSSTVSLRVCEARPDLIIARARETRTRGATGEPSSRSRRPRSTSSSSRRQATTYTADTSKGDLE
jgi:hypothetical protein